MNLQQYKAFDSEMKAARLLFTQADYDPCFHHLERAHILAQRYTSIHVQTHWWMLRVGIKRGDFREIRGQIIRMVMAVPGSLFGMAPKGNTGGANVGMFRKMDIPEDLKAFNRN